MQQVGIQTGAAQVSGDRKSSIRVQLFLHRTNLQCISVEQQHFILIFVFNSIHKCDVTFPFKVLEHCILS